MLASEAFRISPVDSLYVEADEPSLYSSREILSLQYATRLAANPPKRAYKVSLKYVDFCCTVYKRISGIPKATPRASL